MTTVQSRFAFLAVLAVASIVAAAQPSHASGSMANWKLTCQDACRVNMQNIRITKNGTDIGNIPSASCDGGVPSQVTAQGQVKLSARGANDLHAILNVQCPDTPSGFGPGNANIPANQEPWGVYITIDGSGNVSMTRIGDRGGIPAAIFTATFGDDCGSVIVRSVRVVDLDGDTDNYADTGETADLYVTVSNKSGADITALALRLSTRDPKIDCVLNALASIPLLAAGTDLEVPTPFRFKVDPAADRAGAVPAVLCTDGACSNGAGACAAAADCTRSITDDYSAAFDVSMSADQFVSLCNPQKVTLDLDLNGANPVLFTTSFAEGFEGGFGNFQFQNLDSFIASNALSDGRRCQYRDPDFPGSDSFGDPTCFLGFAAGQVPLNDWHVHTTATADGGRAFLGGNSLHYGKHTPGFPTLDTYGLAQMDAIRTKSGVNLAARRCAALQGGLIKSCNVAADCVTPASACIPATPELSFVQQISTVDSRTLSVPEGEALDRAVVQVQVVQGAGLSVWQKIHPYENIYDVRGTDTPTIANCLFDPIDDGNDEDSYFDPCDPDRRFGASSTCMPELSFSYLGNTDLPFDPANIGRASDGPGLAGSLGTGTWVESLFDLSRYRGRSIRIRFLFTSMESEPDTSHEELRGWNPIADDDGWYIDNIRVDETVGALQPTASLDGADNSGLPPCPCAVPGEASGLVFANLLTLAWSPPGAPGAPPPLTYDTIRTTDPSDFGPAAATCVETDGEDLITTDLAIPSLGSVLYYAVRAENPCGAGIAGMDSGGTPYAGRRCPGTAPCP